MFKLYAIAGILGLACTAIGVILVRKRKAPIYDQVSQNVLDRIRTDYR